MRRAGAQVSGLFIQRVSGRRYADPRSVPTPNAGRRGDPEREAQLRSSSTYLDGHLTMTFSLANTPS